MSYPVKPRFYGIFCCPFWHISLYSVLDNGNLTEILTEINGNSRSGYGRNQKNSLRYV
nr:MAG TPA: hypothetical protein [Caudoviricetes sp.]